MNKNGIIPITSDSNTKQTRARKQDRGAKVFYIEKIQRTLTQQQHICEKKLNGKHRAQCDVFAIDDVFTLNWSHSCELNDQHILHVTRIRYSVVCTAIEIYARYSPGISSHQHEI